MTIKTKKTLFIAFTLLFSAIMLTASGLFLVEYDMAKDWFMGMGIHPIMVFPIAMAQILGVILLWSKIQFAAVTGSVDNPTAVSWSATVGSRNRT